MKILKAAFRFDDGRWHTCDIIEYKGKTWIVGTWLENQGLGISKPERIILLDDLSYTRENLPPLENPVDLVLLTPIPKSVFDLDKSPPELAPFVVIDHPDITVELPSGTIH